MSLASELLKSIKENFEAIALKFNEIQQPAAVTFVDHQLSDGTVISIDKVEIGGKATIGGVAAEGEYELADGTKLKVSDGTITEVEMKMPEDQMPMDAVSEALFSEYKKVTDEKLAALSASFSEMLELTKQQFSLVEEISKEPIAKPLDNRKKLEEMTPLERRRFLKD